MSPVGGTTTCALCRPRRSGVRFVRFESRTPDRLGRHPGLFGLLRDLRCAGRLSAPDESRASDLVERAYALHVEPPTAAFADGAGRSWFRTHPGVCAGPRLGALCADVIELLEAHGVDVRVAEARGLAGVTYTDDVQVVAVSTTDEPGLTSCG